MKPVKTSRHQSSMADRVCQIQSYLQAQIASIAGIYPSQVDFLQPLTHLGFDSLMGIELKDRLMVDLEIDVPLPDLLEDTPTGILADRLASLVVVAPADADRSLALKNPPPEQLTQSRETGNLRYSLSQGQWGLWFIYRLLPTSAAYNIAFTARICSVLDLDALRRSVQALIDRHPSLRTTYGQEDTEPFQEVHATQTLDFQQIDAATWDEEKLLSQAIAIHQRPFDLESGSVLRATVLTQASDRQVLMLTVHHIAVDGVSFGILLDELQLLYRSEITDRPLSLPAINYQYPDFVQSQQRLLNSSAGEQLWRYWQQQLAAAPTLMLPSDRPPSPTKSSSGAAYTFELPTKIAAQLKDLAKSQGVTLYVLLLTTFKILLHLYTGQEDIVVGTPANGRNQTEFAKTVGFFVNMIILRSNLTGNPTCSELLDRVRHTVLEAIAHQSYPASLLVERLGLKRDQNLLGYFRASFNLLNLAKMGSIFELSVSDRIGMQMKWGDLVLEPFVIPQQEGQNDLVFDVMETSDRLIGIFRYSTDLFEASTIERLAAHFETLVTGIIAHPDQPISHLPMLTATEQQKILWDWNNTHTDAPQNLCIHQLFERQVAKTPAAIAVVFGDRQLTYQELNQHSNQLARYLQTLGVHPGVLVGLCVDRSLEMPIGMLAILKAGGAYVPLDPDYPPARLAYMVADAQMPVLLTQESLLSRLPTHAAQVCCLERDWPIVAATSSENLVTTVTPADLAYVIYTSGSTGQPKGVMITQQNLVNFCQAAISAYEITSADRMLQFASIGFDAAVEEIYPALVRGATIYLRTPEMLDSAKTFGDKCQLWQLTFIALPTAYWHQLTSELIHTQERLPSAVRLVIIGGERVNPSQVQCWQQHFGHYPKLVNTYGPTEATVEATYCDLSHRQCEFGQEAPIGRPLANIQTYILNARLQPRPIGMTGELYIGGASVARGYLHRPELTAAKFLPDPFSKEPQARLYKTGDLARYLPDGNIEYLGRIDQQVKIRGFRIELGEVEAAIGKHPQVSQVIVIAREDSPGHQQLVAYIVTTDREMSSAEIRDYLKQQLPHYMLPAAVVCLNELPLTPNGKVDRRALPVPQFSPELAADFVSPRNITEEKLAAIWSRVLKVDKIGVHDRFFDLGGHSLLATTVVYQIGRAFDINFPLRNLLDNPTISSLQVIVDRLQANANGGESHQHLSHIQLSPVKHRPGTRLPLSLSQQYIWHVHESGRSSTALNSSMMVRVSNSLSPAVLEQSVNEIVHRHEIFRTMFIVDRDRPMQMTLSGLHLPLIYEDFQFLPPDCRESAASSLGFSLSQQHFDLATAPLLRVALLRLSSQEQWVLISMHHIITDGWSFNLLLRELDVLTKAFASDLPPKLPVVPLQYSDFVHWQQQVYTETLLDKQLDYWRRKLVEVDRPTAKFAPQHLLTTTQARCYLRSFSADLSQAIAAFSHDRGISPFVVLLAGFKLALAKWSGHQEILVVTTIGNRTEPGTESMMGCFINDAIVRSHLSSGMTGVDLFGQLQATINEAIEHKEVPLHRVMDYIQGYRPLNLMANISVTSVVQELDRQSDWEIVPMSTFDPDWEHSSVELCDTTTPLEIYIELSSRIRIVANYSIEVWNAETIADLFVNYENILTQLTSQSHLLLANL